MLAFLAGLVLLETIPVAAVLETGATLQAGDPNQSAVALWLLALVTVLAVAVGRASARLNAASTVITSVPAYLATLVIVTRISPAAYGSLAEGPFGTAWLQALGSDLLNGTSRVSAVFGLAVIVGYLWWRGLRLGRTATSIEAARTLFLFSFAAMVVAVSVAAAVHGQGQQALTGRLGFLLPLEAFAGLATLSIARTNTLADDVRSVVWTGSNERGTWFWLGLIISGATLVVASVVSLFASYDAVIAGLRDLGPLGELVGAGLEWLIYGVVYLVYLVIGGPIDWIIKRVENSKYPFQVPQPRPPSNNCANPACIPHITPARGIAVGIFLGVVLVVVVGLLLYIVYRAIKSMRSSAIYAEHVEEREALDASGLLGAQLRGLLAGLRRTPGQPDEVLAAGSVRAIYRDVLRVAAAAGLPRGPSETPDEYRERLGRPAGDAGAPADGDDLATLTSAYDRERYGGEELPQAERRGLQARVHRIVAGLKDRSRASTSARSS